MDTTITFSNDDAQNKQNLYLRQWLQNTSLTDALQQTEQHIRQEPESLKWRSIYLELLCVLRQWERALKALDMYIKLDPSQKANLAPLERLIRAEIVREAVFEGKQNALTLSPAPAWMEDFAQAMVSNAHNDHEKADTLRSQALNAMEESPDFIASNEAGFESNLGTSQWIVDADSRLSAVFECIAAPGYRWIPLYDLISFQTTAPQSLLDLVWLPVEIKTRQQANQATKVYIPVRYPAQKNHQDSDSALLAKMTQWFEFGSCSVFASGQKTFITDTKDWPLLELRSWKLRPSNK